jgi:uncharacterized surface protein with fasciclin (FAS1) repeats
MMMTNNMKAKHSLAVFGLLCTLNMACTDTWNEHYDTAVADSGTLWQKISDPQGNTQQFARVLEACGYKEVLDGSQTYTVFAPADDTFSAQQADSVIALYNSEKAAGQTDADNKAVKQFVQNHIALYSHPVSSLTNDTLTLMNRKYYPLSSQKLGGRTLTSAARLCNNGLLFTLSGKLNYFPNIFEYLGEDSETDSAYQFFRRYSIYEFDETKSVVGDVIDGRTIYLDSVSTLTNRLFDIYGRINSEDSTYWMLCPSNDEWNRLVSEYTPYFNYPNNVAKRDSLVYTHTRLAFMGGTIFSASRNTEKSLQDSAVSTMAQSALIRSLLDTEPYYIYAKPYADGGIFSGTQDVACSNGHVLKARQFGVSMYDTFMQTVKVEAENLASQDNLVDAIDPVTIHQVTTSNPFYGKVSGNSFVEIKPSTPTSSVVVRYSVPNLLSGMKYDVMAVFVPATAADTLAREEAKKPCRVVSRVAQTDQNGKLSEPPLRNAKTTKAGVVDTVKMSTVTISTCSYGLTDALVKLDIKSNVQETQLSTYSNTLRLDCIIFKPVK